MDPKTMARLISQLAEHRAQNTRDEIRPAPALDLTHARRMRAALADADFRRRLAAQVSTRS